MKQSCGTESGHEIFFVNYCYQCPRLKLFGYATERQIRNAIKRKLHAERKGE